MVATRGQCRKRPTEQEQEPPKTEYERILDERVAANAKVFEPLGLLKLSTELSNSLPQSATKKGKTSANKKTSSEDSDTSEYLLENDDQGGSYDDETESDAQPQPTKSPLGYSQKVLASKKKTGPNMLPGGRAGKRVRAPKSSQVQPPRAQLRSSKKLQLSLRDGQTAEEGNGAGAEQGNGAGVQDIAAAEEDIGAGAQDMTHADEDNVVGVEGTKAPAQ